MSKDKSAKKPFYKRVWFIALVIIVVIVIAANAGGGDKKTTSTTGTTNTSEQTEAKFDSVSFFDKVQTGMTKAQVDALTTKKPSCTESQDATFGTSMVCSYGNLFTDKAAVSVIFMNDAVQSKTRQTN